MLALTQRHRLAPGVIILFFLYSLVLAFHLGLTADGAHYALYGKHLSLSYYDHPPMVGWLQAISERLWGLSTISLRVFPLLFSVLTMSLLYRLGESTLLVLLVGYGMGVMSILSIALLPMVPLMFFGLCSFYFFKKLLAKDKLSCWLLLGLALGCAGLSDYSAVCLAVGLTAYMLFYKREYLVRPGFYLMLLVAAITVSPVFIWNYQHHFISFTSQLHHGFNHHWSWASFAVSIALQIVAYSPLLFIYGIVAAVKTLRSDDVIKKAYVFFAVPVLLLFFISGGFNRILFHWPALGWVFLIPLAADTIIESWHKRSTKLITSISFLTSFIFYVFLMVQAVWHPFPFKVGHSPLNDMFGWQQAAQTAKKSLLQYEKNNQLKNAVLFVNNWSYASRIAWYSQAPVQIAQITDKIAAYQYASWFGAANQGSSGILIQYAADTPPPAHSSRAGQFSECNFLKTFPVMVKHKVFNRFSLYQCRGFNSSS